MAATNFDKCCVSPDYAMQNSWKHFRLITDDFSCYLYSCHKIMLCLHFNDTFWKPMDWTWIPSSMTPSITSPDPSGFPFLGIHESLGVRDSHGDITRSCGTNKSSSWRHSRYAGNLSKNSAWYNQAIHKMYRSWWRPCWAPSVCEKIVFYDSISIVSFTPFLAFVVQTAYVLLCISETLAHRRSVFENKFIKKIWSHCTIY